jgi:hypothetical protein
MIEREIDPTGERSSWSETPYHRSRWSDTSGQFLDSGPISILKGGKWFNLVLELRAAPLIWTGGQQSDHQDVNYSRRGAT